MAALPPKWKAATAYAQGEQVLNPSGQVVSALAGFTSGATYDSTKWSTPAAGGSAGPLIYVTPSGNATGAADSTAIAAALTAGNVVLVGDFVVNAPIEMPSNRTLVLWDAEVRLAPFSNCVLLRNKNQNATGDRNIRVVGIGRARLRSVTGARIAVHTDAGATQLTTTRIFRRSCPRHMAGVPGTGH